VRYNRGGIVESLKQTLAKHPFLQGVNADYLPFMAECASEKLFEAGQYILREKEEANEFYLLLQGRVALGTFIPGRGFTTVQTLGEGEVVGWSWFVPPHRWRFDALVIIPIKVIALDGKRIREKCEADHDFGYALAKQVAQVVGERLTSTRKRLEV
jgi:CRP-like cAMP-binding protein